MTPRKAGIALAAVLILAGLNAGCSTVQIRGTVTEMEHELSKKVCASKKPGSKGSPACTVVAECWEMDVEDINGVEHEFCLNKSEWEKYRVGDMYPHKQRN